MAAHVKTALDQIIRGTVSNPDHIETALNLSCWSEDLDFSDYCDFSSIFNSRFDYPVDKRMGMIVMVAKQLLPKYTAVWEKLGKPETREEWHKVKFATLATNGSVIKGVDY